jgi:hypothetical protein
VTKKSGNTFSYFMIPGIPKSPSCACAFLVEKNKKVPAIEKILYIPLEPFVGVALVG